MIMINSNEISHSFKQIKKDHHTDADVFIKPFLKNQRLLGLSQKQKIGLLKQEVCWNQHKASKTAQNKTNKVKCKKNQMQQSLLKDNCSNPNQQIKEMLKKVSLIKENVSQNIQFLVLNKKITRSMTKSQLSTKSHKNSINKSPQSPVHRKSISHFQIFKMAETQNYFYQQKNIQAHSYNILSKIVSKSSKNNILNLQKKAQQKRNFDRKRSQTMQVQKNSTNSSNTNTETILHTLRKQRQKNIKSANKVLGKEKAEALVRKNSLFLLNFIKQKQKQIQYQKNRNDFNPHINHISNMTNQINLNQVKREHQNQKKLKKQKNLEQRIKYSAKLQRKPMIFKTDDKKLLKQSQKIQPW